ncbi:MAG: AAA family ATPase [Nannocystaceae bacterium]
MSSLDLENIGPFGEAHLVFQKSNPKVTFITGENGTGKSIVIDAIRGLFGPPYVNLERSIWRNGVPFSIRGSFRRRWDSGEASTEADFVVHVDKKLEQGRFDFLTPTRDWTDLPGQLQTWPRACPNWVIDYWRSDLTHDDYDIKTLLVPDTRSYLVGALQGSNRNAAATEWITFFDYLRDSRDPRERTSGETLFAIARRIIEASLLEGELSHVERRTLTPIIRQSGQEVPLRNLSSGNAYLIQRLLGLLGKMYAVHTLRQTPPETLCDTPGLLLIDEAENHLHPRWQKRLITDILSVFPNLQIIATTHSPFLLASVAGAKVYVCRYDRERSSCVIDDATDRYATQPVDEILVSPAFDHTQPYGAKITGLLEERKAAISRDDQPERRRIEAELLGLNPEHFAYFEIDEKLRLIAGGTR